MSDIKSRIKTIEKKVNKPDQSHILAVLKRERERFFGIEVDKTPKGVNNA